jgi:hypothetical protein
MTLRVVLWFFFVLRMIKYDAIASLKFFRVFRVTIFCDEKWQILSSEVMARSMGSIL